MGPSEHSELRKLESDLRTLRQQGDVLGPSAIGMLAYCIGLIADQQRRGVDPDALVKALHRIAFPGEYEGSAEWSRGVAFAALKAWREASPATGRGTV